jgi:hypothetical protein
MSFLLKVRVMEISLAIVRFAVGKSARGRMSVISQWDATRNESLDLSSG